MAAVPTRHPAVGLERDSEGRVTLLLPLPQGRWGRLLGRFMKIPQEVYKRLELDEIGTLVWDSCDGRRTVRDIVRGVIERYGFSRREGEMATVSFLRRLARRGCIVLAFYGETKRDEDPS